MKNAVVGKWRLVAINRWNQATIDLVGPGYATFERRGTGRMRFGAADLTLNWNSGRGGKVEFTFEGFDELDEVSGRGWAKAGSQQLSGHIGFHQGNQSAFTEEKWRKKK